MAYFIGIDQSLRGTGVAVLEDDILVPVLLHRIETKALRAVTRLAAIRDAIKDLLIGYQPVLTAMEGYSYGSTGRVFELGEAGGVIKLALYDQQRQFLIVPPSSLKLFVADDGAADKAKMARCTLAKWKRKIDQDDLCDAYGLARVARTMHTQTSTFRCELEVIRSLGDKDYKPKMDAPSKVKRST